jgi:single-strand DNA-binding protein
MGAEMTGITVTGFVASDIEGTPAAPGQEAAASFRLGTVPAPHESPQWFTVNLSGPLATNAAASLRKGQRVIVSGRFGQRQWESHGQIRSELTLDASALGHDLTFGSSTFTANAA